MKKARPGRKTQTTVELGWAADPLHKQLGVPRKDLEHLQSDATAITRLRIRGYLTDSALDRAYARVLKQIPEAIEEGRRKRRERRAEAAKRRKSSSDQNPPPRPRGDQAQ